MKPFSTTWFVLALVAAVSPALVAAATDRVPPNQTAVRTLSGRTFVGLIDPRSNAQTLWIRWQRSGVTVNRPIAWQSITGAEVAGEAVSGEDLRRLVTAATEAARTLPPRAARGTSAKPVPEVTATSPPSPGISGREEPAVASLAVTATLGNWDADGEPDGLWVTIQPIDALGRGASGRGTLTVTLLGERRGGAVPDSPFQTIGRWTHRVETDDFHDGTATYRLPWQEVNPLARDAYAARAAVRARLALPGQGVVEAGDDFVRIVPASPIRDRMEQLTGRR